MKSENKIVEEVVKEMQEHGALSLVSPKIKLTKIMTLGDVVEEAVALTYQRLKKVKKETKSG